MYKTRSLSSERFSRRPFSDLHFHLPSDRVLLFKRRAKTAKLSMISYFLRLMQLDPLAKNLGKPPCFPGMICELGSGALVYIIDRDVTSGRVIVLFRGRSTLRHGGWDPRPVAIKYIDVYGVADDLRVRNMRRPRRDFAERLRALSVYAEENVSSKLVPMTEAEELACDPDHRRKLGLCVACGGAIEPKEKQKGHFICARCAGVS
jgi:hypothetical protein